MAGCSLGNNKLRMVWVSALWQLPYNHYGDWQWGFKEVVQIISPILDKYDHVVWETGRPSHIFYPVLFKIPCGEYQKIPRQGYDFGNSSFVKFTGRMTKT